MEKIGAAICNSTRKTRGPQGVNESLHICNPPTSKAK